jgi:hypothetical protein
MTPEIDLKPYEPVLCPDCEQPLYATPAKDQPNSAVFGSCKCDRQTYDVPRGSIMWGPKGGPMFIYKPKPQ